MTGENGQNLGIMPVHQAIFLAQDAGLDLVEIVPQANPPVCKIMDFGKFKFEQKKKFKDQQQKSKVIKPKEVQLRPVSQDHDIDVKIKQIREFLTEKRTVSVMIKFKNRELAHKDQGAKILHSIIEKTADLAKVDSPPKMDGKNMHMRLLPK